MDFAPVPIKSDVDRFLRHLGSFKNRRAAWLETQNEIRLLPGGSEILAEKRAHLDRRRYLMDVAFVRLETSSQSLMDGFPSELTHRIAELLSEADEPLRRHLYEDTEQWAFSSERP
jgi:hypothetical protein